jgi:nucleotide-binding universal stress UspA family protein
MMTIVVGFDGHAAAARALERALAEARDRRGRLVVVAVMEMPLDPTGLQTFGTLDDSPAPGIPVTPPPEIEAVLAAARARVDAAGAAADYSWAAGEPASAIVGAARDCGADLIVVGEHHHGMLARLAGTDVAAEVERTAGCDVIAVA